MKSYKICLNWYENDFFGEKVSCIYGVYTLIYILKHPFEAMHTFKIESWSIVTHIMTLKKYNVSV